MTEEERAKLLALADRVEALAGPDREVDAEIACAIKFRNHRPAQPDDFDGKYGYSPGDIKVDTGFLTAESYTRSLDAAMTLLDRHGVLLHLSDIGADGLPYARVGRPDLDEAPIFSGISSGIAVKATPTSGLAIALTAASLRARARAAQ